MLSILGFSRLNPTSGPIRRLARDGSGRRAYWGPEHGFIETPVRRLDSLGARPVRGPLLVDGYDATIVVPPGSTIKKGEWGNAVIIIGGGGTKHGR